MQKELTIRLNKMRIEFNIGNRAAFKRFAWEPQTRIFKKLQR